MKHILWILFLCVTCVASARQRSACPDIKLKNGRVRRKYIFAQFNCNRGFMLYGEKFSKCTMGAWEALPICVQNRCNVVREPANGEYFPLHRGAVIKFWCKPGYELKGASTIFCDGKVWNDNSPTCVASGTQPALSCDFEDMHLCGWSQDLNHDFDWTRYSYNLTTWHVTTGPKADHTKGTQGIGHYMYIDASKSNTSETAKLISPIYNSNKAESSTCLQFFYHMQHSGNGQLRVYVKNITSAWDLNSENAVFSKTGFQGNRWNQGFVQLGVIPVDYQIIFEGVKGNDPECDIAIDDVKIIEDCVVDNEIITTTESEVTETISEPESCYNRCGIQNNSILTRAFSCACDDICILSSSCCPDYYVYCILVQTFTDYALAEFTTTELPTEIDTETMNPTTEKVTTVTAPKRIETSTNPAPTVIIRKAVNTTAKPEDSKKTPPSTAKPTNKKDYSPNDVYEKPLKPDKKITATTSAQKVTIVTKPTVRIFIKTTPPKIIWKKVAFGNDSAAAAPPTKKPSVMDDVETLPPRVDEGLLITMQPEKKENNAKYTNVVYTGQSSEEAPPKKGHSTGLVVAFLVIGAVLIVCAGFFYARRKRTVRNCLNFRMKSSARGDSQSDIRFLASEEYIDFTLARPDDNDCM